MKELPKLWLDLNGGNTGQVTVTVKYADQQITVVDPNSYENGINEVTLPIQANEESKADILFVVDATGSMGDEIEYLKSELKDVIGRAEDLNSPLDLRVDQCFTATKGDEFLTRVSPSQVISDRHLNLLIIRMPRRRRL